MSAKNTQKNAPGKPFSKGNKGKPKGALNKNTKALKDMILGALDKCGGEKYLQQQALDNPNAFLQLIGKVLPTTLAGDPNAPVSIQIRWQNANDNE